jgi:hypothetical protein
MATSQTARAGPDPVTVPQDTACLAACRILSATDREPHQDALAWSPADWRLAIRGSSELELELSNCTPVACDSTIHAHLWARGVRNLAGLQVEPVAFLPNNRFELARHARDASEAIPAVVFATSDELGKLIDLAAWQPETGRLALLLGRVSMLGQDNLYGWRLGEPLIIHESPFEWLRAGREGAFVIDPQRASPLLRMVEPLGVKRPEFGRRLHAALTIRSPRVVVAAPQVAAA